MTSALRYRPAPNGTAALFICRLKPGQRQTVLNTVQAQPNSFMANPECQILVMCRILSPSKSIT